jgi:hypothetical protein
MTSRTPSDPLKKCRGLWQHISTRSRAPHKHSTAAGILAVSKPILAFSPSQLHLAPIPRESSVVSVYRNTSDTAQAFLPPVQAVADVIPGVGGVIKGVIGGILSTLQLVDVIRFRYLGILDTEPRHYRDTSGTRTTWRSSHNDCTAFFAL